MKWNVRFAVLLLATLLSGCGTSGPVTEGYCSLVGPIFVGDLDDLTDETARQILAHNETWERVCGTSALD